MRKKQIYGFKRKNKIKRNTGEYVQGLSMDRWLFVIFSKDKPSIGIY